MNKPFWIPIAQQIAMLRIPYAHIGVRQQESFQVLVRHGASAANE